MHPTTGLLDLTVDPLVRASSIHLEPTRGGQFIARPGIDPFPASGSFLKLPKRRLRLQPINQKLASLKRRCPVR